MSKFTVGPWEQVETHVFVKGQSFRIAICDSNIAERAEEWANARLVAAAPDLFEACCRFMAWIDDKSSLESMHHQKERISKAIAKAEGVTK